MSYNGRPTYLEGDLLVGLVRALIRGVPGEEAAASFGIPRRTWYRWLKRGRAGEAPYVALAEAIATARRRARERRHAVRVDDRAEFERSFCDFFGQ